MGSAGATIVFVLWVPFLEQCMKLGGFAERLNYIGVASRTALLFHYTNYDNFPSSTAGYVLWLASEVPWWFIITLLLTVLGAFVGGTEPWKLFYQSTALSITVVAKAFQLRPLRSRVRAGPLRVPPVK